MSKNGIILIYIGFYSVGHRTHKKGNGEVRQPWEKASRRYVDEKIGPVNNELILKAIKDRSAAYHK